VLVRLGIAAGLVLADPDIETVVGHLRFDSAIAGRTAVIERQLGVDDVRNEIRAPHRKPAFEAALQGINRLKKIVPIWKKEHFADGEVWVDGEWDDSVLGR